MPLPTRGEEFLPCALKAFRPDGFLHFYDMQRPELFTQSVEKLALHVQLKTEQFSPPALPGAVIVHHRFIEFASMPIFPEKIIKVL